MDELSIRKDRHAGRITFTRPKALNALSHRMVQQITRTLKDWRDDPAISLIIIDAEGERAFCAGGDIAAVYEAGKSGDHEIGQEFFADEYRMNAAIHEYPKPVVAFMQGFVMGGGVGVGGHASVRVVGDTTRLAMPETGIGLIPDVGGTWLLARAPGRIGEYLGVTGTRIGAGDAIHAGLADIYLPEAEWPAAIERLADRGTTSGLSGQAAPDAALASRNLAAFGGRNIGEIIAALERQGDEDALVPLRRNSPLSMAATLVMVRAARGDRSMRESLGREYRFTARATAEADFLEGVRAQIIDKDRNPQWSAASTPAKVDAMLADLGRRELNWED